MLIRYVDGSFVDAAIYRVDGGRIRAAVAGLDDAADFRLVEDEWVSEEGRVVWFEFPIDIGVDITRILPAPVRAEHACAAGGDCLLRRVSSGNALNS